MASEYADIGIPDKIEITKNFQHLVIIREWFGSKFIFLTLFVIVWDIFLVNWYGRAFALGTHGGIDLMFVLFPIGHVAVGIGLTYYVLAGYLNQTNIDVDFNSITIKHGPLPFWGNMQIPSKMVSQLYCTDEIYSTRGSGGYRTFTVRAITSDHRNIKLLSGLDNREQALFIEQEIEKFLNIEDKPVKGEIR